MDKSIQISMLLELYGKLLTETQADTVDLYYNQNLSLSEIAEELNITRQGVRKNLVYAEKKLFDFEEKLSFLKQKLENSEIIKEVIEKIEDDVLKDKLSKLL
jgi:predicted DNA-binding protein YlxM (UPF0122 family)